MNVSIYKFRASAKAPEKSRLIEIMFNKTFVRAASAELEFESEVFYVMHEITLLRCKAYVTNKEV